MRGSSKQIKAAKTALGMAVLGLMALAAPEGAQAEGTPKFNLVVQANAFKGTKGQALFALYDSKDAWLKPARAKQIVKAKISGSSVTATFTDLAPNSVYAVSVIHDENMNGKLDMHWFPIPGPDEGAGVSNDAKASLGPPSFDDCRLRIQGSGQIALTIRY